MENGVQLHPRQAKPPIPVLQRGSWGRKAASAGSTKQGQRGAGQRFILIQCEAGRAAAAACGSPRAEVWERCASRQPSAASRPPIQQGKKRDNSYSGPARVATPPNQSCLMTQNTNIPSNPGRDRTIPLSGLLPRRQ